jgi:hypothetical protein
MSIPAVAHRFAFGVRGEIRGGAQYLDDSTVLYPIGSNIVLHNPETRHQRFIPLSEKSEQIVVVVLSPSKKYLAVSERSAGKPSIVVYDVTTLRRRRVLHTQGDFEAKVRPFSEEIEKRRRETLCALRKKKSRKHTGPQTLL